MDKRGGGGRTEGVSRHSVKIFLSHSTEKFRSGTFPFFTNFLVSKNFMNKRLGKKEGGASWLSVKKNFLTVPKNFTGEPFRAPQNVWCRKKSMDKKAGGGGKREGVS